MVSNPSSPCSIHSESHLLDSLDESINEDSFTSSLYEDRSLHEVSEHPMCLNEVKELQGRRFTAEEYIQEIRKIEEGFYFDKFSSSKA
ncbi:hypothetical protein PORY_002603 [Pneumocystis oryctolagi]|uniref:Uncharacterized protein n=1 Tax=Pneumocystis oryctolagi TaxID=42067 RepID=A0ACB7C939_9ASCO|nr:hypothetical protein PORY_002603 [Pneumocystis oryctolagi]